MNKEIKELTGDICYACHSRKVCTGENCYVAKGIAEELYNKGYQKAEYDVYDLGIVIDNARKETAKEILQEIKKREMWFINSHMQGEHLNEQINELAKKYGVEIE